MESFTGSASTSISSSKSDIVRKGSGIVAVLDLIADQAVVVESLKFSGGSTRSRGA